jgi:hypothetical protein
MAHHKLPILEEKGYVVLKKQDLPDPKEWLDLEYLDWKSSGDTRFAPIASATGEMDCNGFWFAGKPDKGGVWTKNKDVAPTLVRWVENVGADYGRVRVIELQPTPYNETEQNLHQDDNNRINPEGTGWVVRCFFNLSDDRDSFFVLREKKDDASTESRIPLPAGQCILIDTERLFHAATHVGSEPRYCLITSFESGPELEKWVDDNLPADSAA